MWKRVVTVIMQVLVEIDTVQGTFLLHKATFLYYKELIGASLSCTIAHLHICISDLTQSQMPPETACSHVFVRQSCIKLKSLP